MIPRLFSCVHKSENKGEHCQKKNYSPPWSHNREILNLSSEKVCFTISTQMPASTVYSQTKTTNHLNFHVQNFEKLHVNSSVTYSRLLEKDAQKVHRILIEDVDRDKLPHERHDTSETPKRQHIVSNRNNIIYFPVPVQNYQYHKINWTHMVPGSLTILFSFAISLHDWKRSIGTHSISSPNLSMPITAYTLLTIMSPVEKHRGSSLSS